MSEQINWQARAERAEKACAEMMEAIEFLFKETTDYHPQYGYLQSYSFSPKSVVAERLQHALSTDCGSGYVRREELDAAHEELFAHAKVAARVEMGLKEELNAAKAEVDGLRETLFWVHGNWSDCFHDATSSCKICKALGKE